MNMGSNWSLIRNTSTILLGTDVLEGWCVFTMVETKKHGSVVLVSQRPFCPLFFLTGYLVIGGFRVHDFNHMNVFTSDVEEWMARAISFQDVISTPAEFGRRFIRSL